MNEADWRTCVTPKPMLRFLVGTDAPRVQELTAFPNCRSSDRRLRLFACACYEHIAQLLPDPRARDAVHLAQRFAEGEAATEELQRCELQIREHLDALEGRWRAARGVERITLAPTHLALAQAAMATRSEAAKAAYYAASNAALAAAQIQNPNDAPHDLGWTTTQKLEERAQTDLLRCIFGNLFAPIRDRPTWITTQAADLAHAIYAENAFDRVPILVDILANAGCEDERILEHGRSAGLHARGCWVVDCVLGRSD